MKVKELINVLERLDGDSEVSLFHSPKQYVSLDLSHIKRITPENNRWSGYILNPSADAYPRQQNIFYTFVDD